ncbi:MAG: amylo-alpha-1,6-glucosidase [Nostocaceae cyanobacterium]|nr:amylo-alpha-1,6-glucosidase [Nostocaceae cyanobacterium]
MDNFNSLEALENLDTREWLLTNGLGSFASGTVADVRTRTYHGWLIAALEPPSQRTLLLSHLEASLELPGRVVALGTNFWGSGEIEPKGYQFLRSFQINPVPEWNWGEDNWELTRRLVMPYGVGDSGLGGQRQENSEQVPGEHISPIPDAQFSHRLLIQYRYEGSQVATLRLRLLVSDRDFHHQQISSRELQFSQLVMQQQVCLQAINSGEAKTAWHLCWTQGDYQADGVWYWNYKLSQETKRGLGDREDLYSPGYLTVTLKPGETVTLEARVGFPDQTVPPLTRETFDETVAAEERRLQRTFRWGTEDEGMLGCGDEKSNSQSDICQQLLKASDQFIVYRASIGGPTVIAGYHWFSDWGRDTLIALPGLALCTKRFELAKGLLRTFGSYCRYGLIPNGFPDAGGEPFYNSVDAALWWIETLGLYLEATQDWEFLAEQYPVVQQIYKSFVTGTNYNIQVDARDWLVSWDAPRVALTWMDAVVGGEAVTPRRGKPVEINALWYSALCWASGWAERLGKQAGEPGRLLKQARRYTEQAQQVKASLQKFWNPQMNYLYDTIEPDDRPNAQIRPNAVIALSLHHCGFESQQGCQVLEKARSSLLTPYGLRTLDSADPEYVGKYWGNPLRRDRAYHQGTVWSWLIGPFIQAWERFYPAEPLPFDWHPLLEHFLSRGCIGSIAEIFDGDAPHTPGGAVAQAWSVAEVIRHYPGSNLPDVTILRTE